MLQAGKNNTSILEQSTFLGTPNFPLISNDTDVDASIMQAGRQNVSRLSQGGNDTGQPSATVKMEGNKNSLTDANGDIARQEGRSELTLRMLGNQNEFIIGPESGGGEQTASVANVDIEGNRNTFRIQQKQREAFNRHNLEADVLGNRNDVEVLQGSRGAFFDQQQNNEALLDVFGDGNTVTIQQDGGFGTENKSPGVTGPISSNNNFAETVVNGTGNNVTVKQGDIGAPWALDQGSIVSNP